MKDTSPDFLRPSDAEMAIRLQALAHPTRLSILRMLSRRDSCCCKDVVGVVGLAQSTVSQHLKVLVEAGLVRYATERQASRYSLEPSALGELAGAIGELLGECCSPLDPCSRAGEYRSIQEE